MNIPGIAERADNFAQQIEYCHAAINRWRHLIGAEHFVDAIAYAEEFVHPKGVIIDREVDGLATLRQTAGEYRERMLSNLPEWSERYDVPVSEFDLILKAPVKLQSVIRAHTDRAGIVGLTESERQAFRQAIELRRAERPGLKALMGAHLKS